MVDWDGRRDENNNGPFVVVSDADLSKALSNVTSILVSCPIPGFSALNVFFARRCIESCLNIQIKVA
jgi:hypothetical protein